MAWKQYYYTKPGYNYLWIPNGHVAVLTLDDGLLVKGRQKMVVLWEQTGGTKELAAGHWGLLLHPSVDATNKQRVKVTIKRIPSEKEALIVGVSDYKYINDLSYCDEDASDWYKFLRKKLYKCVVLGDGHPENYPIYNGNATEALVRTVFKRMLARSKTVVLVTSGHGGGDGKGNSYICLRNFSGGNDKYMDKELLADIRTKPTDTKVFIFIDNCFSGGFLDELQTIPNVICLTTCSANGYGYDDPTSQHGMWTNQFLKEGLIKQFKYGSCTVDEAFTWAKEHYPMGVTNPGDIPQRINTMTDQSFTL